MADGLVINPTELRFKFELRKTIPVTLGLANQGSERIAFKVKTTSPKKYCVRPSSGIVEPGSSRDVQVIMQAQREFPASLSDVKDKFLVQYCVVGPEVREVVADTFDGTHSKDVRQTKLRVVLVGPPKPPSPVPEGVEEETSPVKDAFKDTSVGPTPAVSAGGVSTSEDIISVTRERNALRDQLQRAEKEKADVKKRVELLQLQGENRGSQVSQAPAKTGFGIISVLLVALLAFLLGHYASSLAGGGGLSSRGTSATHVVKAVNATLTGKHSEL